MKRGSRLTLALGGGLLLAVMVGAVAAAAPQAVAGNAATTVSVLIKDSSLTAAPKTVPTGKVTFVVRNAGKASHELVILRTDTSAKALAVRGSKAVETGAKGRIGAFGAGATKRLTVTLAPGKYVLLSNLPGDFKRGLATGLVATGAGTGGAAQTTKVTVSAFEMGFKLSKTTVPHGTVVFDVVNDGKLPHDMSFGSKGGGTKLLAPGERATLTVTFAKGQFRFICTVEGHAEAGMIGLLTAT